MIPKIAHFHWDQSGPPMSWLRTVSIATFAKFNPTWEVRIIRSDPVLVGHGALQHGHRADLAWWEALRDVGGFQVATDIVFTKPVPDDWLDAELCVCTKGQGRVEQFAMLGSVAGHPFVTAAAQEGRNRCSGGGAMDYQDVGVWMLHGLSKHLGDFKELPNEALCHYNWDWCPMFWSNGFLEDINLPEEAIGCHWYGGDRLGKQNEWAAGPGSDYWIVRLANSVFP